MEETTACLELDGLFYKGKSLRFRRPQNFNNITKVEGTRPVPILDRSKLKIIQTQVENSYNKLNIVNIPETFSEENVIQLLHTYGSLKSFHLVVDKMNCDSKGYAFCEYQTDRATFECLNRLTGQTIVNKVITVKRCNPGMAPPNEEQIYTLEQLHKNLMDNVNREVVSSSQKDVQEEYLKRMLKRNAPKYEGLICDDATTVLKLSNIVDK